MGTNGNGIPLDKAELLSTILEGIFYGFSLLMFGGTICQLFSRRCTGKVNYKMVVVACLLLVCSTVHLVIDVLRILEGLILYRDTHPGGPTAYFSSVSQWTFVSKNYVYAIQTLIGDGVILYRCYVVWQSKLIMILPVLLWSASAVTGCASAYAASQLTTTHSIFNDMLAVWIKTFYATAFVTNVLTTFLLVYRIWYLDQKVAKLRGHSKSQLREILHTIVDAGVIYSLTLLALMICYSFQSNGQYVILDMIVPIISITFYMVIIRVGLFSNRTNQQRNALPHNHTTTHDSFCAGARNRMHHCTTTLSETKVDDGPHSPMSQIIAVDDGSCRYHSETDLDDSGEAV